MFPQNDVLEFSKFFYLWGLFLFYGVSVQSHGTVKIPQNTSVPVGPGSESLRLLSHSFARVSTNRVCFTACGAGEVKCCDTPEKFLRQQCATLAIDVGKAVSARWWRPKPQSSS